MSDMPDEKLFAEVYAKGPTWAADTIATQQATIATQQAQLDRLAGVTEAISKKFLSGNCIEVERVMLRADEWKAMLEASQEKDDCACLLFYASCTGACKEKDDE